MKNKKNKTYKTLHGYINNWDKQSAFRKALTSILSIVWLYLSAREVWYLSLEENPYDIWYRTGMITGTGVKLALWYFIAGLLVWIMVLAVEKLTKK
jgi:hypothetical protein